MAKEKDETLEVETSAEESSKKDKKAKAEKLSKEEKKANKLAAKKEKADNKKAELADEIKALREQIADESDEKKKKKMRKHRDDLIAQRDGITKSKDGATIPMTRKGKKGLTSAICIVLVIALLCAYVCTGTVRHGLLSYFGVPQSTVTAFTLTDGDGNKHSIKVSTYNYYFAMTYNNLQSQQSTYEQYGMDLEQYNLDVDFDEKLSEQTTKNDDGKTVTWLEYIQEEVEESIKSTYMYYYEAVADNKGKVPSITSDQKDEINDTLSDYKDSAKTYGYTLSGYLTAAMGKGVTEKVFRREAKIAYIAENYQSDLSDKLSEKTYSDKEYESYKKEHKDDLMTVNAKIFECDSEDDAKAFKKALNSDGSNFAALASKYSTEDWDKTANKNPVETTYNDINKSSLQSMGLAIATADTDDTDSYPGLDKLFKAKKGDIIQYSTSVVYVLKGSHLPTCKTVNVRHILITPYYNISEDDEDYDEDAVATDATDKQWAAAYKQAKKILKEFNSGKKTESAFSSLAKKNSEDSNADDGGLYENVTPNQMVPTFNAWCFDSSRKAGDTAIVKTEYGYHIMYFVGYGDLNVWQYTAQQALASDDSETTIDKLEKSYKIKESWFGSRFFEKDTDIDS